MASFMGEMFVGLLGDWLKHQHLFPVSFTQLSSLCNPTDYISTQVKIRIKDGENMLGIHYTLYEHSTEIS